MKSPKEIEARILNQPLRKPLPRSMHAVLAVGWGAIIAALAMGDETGGWWWIETTLMVMAALYLVGNLYGVVAHAKLVRDYENDGERREALLKEARTHE